MKMMYLFLVMVAGTISVNALADEDFNAQQIRQLVKQGKILPLETILKKYQPMAQGRLLDLEVEREHGLIVYELEFLKEDGEVHKLVINAADGRLIKQEIDD
jgi:uncharacterized membrane protein YkoI